MTDDISLYGQLSPMKPDALAGFRVGDLCDAPTIGRCRVVALHPPALIEVQTAGGGRCRVGWRALTRVHVPESSQ